MSASARGIKWGCVCGGRDKVGVAEMRLPWLQCRDRCPTCVVVVLRAEFDKQNSGGVGAHSEDEHQGGKTPGRGQQSPGLQPNLGALCVIASARADHQ